jgi:hypothetical protein
MEDKNIGSSFREFLAEQGILEECESIAIEEILKDISLNDQ